MVPDTLTSGTSEPPVSHTRNRARDTRLAVYYDAECGLCRDVARLLGRLDRGRRLHLVDLKRAPLETADSPPLARLRATMHVRDEHGVWATGAAGCIEIAWRIPLLWPIVLVTRPPLVEAVLERGYALVARNRGRLGWLTGASACPTDGQP